jgi:hypothetical protein
MATMTGRTVEEQRERAVDPARTARREMDALATAMTRRQAAVQQPRTGAGEARAAAEVLRTARRSAERALRDAQEAVDRLVDAADDGRPGAMGRGRRRTAHSRGRTAESWRRSADGRRRSAHSRRLSTRRSWPRAEWERSLAALRMQVERAQAELAALAHRREQRKLVIESHRADGSRAAARLHDIAHQPTSIIPTGALTSRPPRRRHSSHPSSRRGARRWQCFAGRRWGLRRASPACRHPAAFS